MSNLTKERLEEIASGQNTVSIPEAVELARELREAREEIERLKESVDSRVPSLVARVATLTAERDEWKWKAIERKGHVLEMEAELAALKSAPAMAEVDALVREIDPSIDLDALDLNPSPVRRLASLARQLGGHINGRDFSIKNIAEKFCSNEIRVPDPAVWSHIWAIERKFEELISSREEVVGLLKVLKGLPGVSEAIDRAVAYRYHEYNAEARRILEIVEGK